MKNVIYIYIWRLLTGMIPPTEDLPFCSNFSIREISQKSRFWGRGSVGGWPKLKEFWKNFDSTWSGNFSDLKSPFFKSGFWTLWGKMTKSGPKTPQNRQKWAKMDKIVQKRILRMVWSLHVHIQPCTPSAGMCAPSLGIP